MAYTSVPLLGGPGVASTDFSGMSGYGAGAASGVATPTGPGVTDGGWQRRLFGGKDADGMQTNGMAGTALNALSGLSNLYFGLKQYGLARKEFKESQRQFDLNFDAQRRLTNSQLRDRQRARVAANPGAYQSVGDYMNQNGIQG